MQPVVGIEPTILAIPAITLSREISRKATPYCLAKQAFDCVCFSGQKG